MKSLTSVMALAVLLTLAGGCHRQEAKEQAQTKSPAQAAKAAPAPAAAGEVQPTILPDAPVAGSELRAVVPGGEAIRQVRWYRNGAAIPGADADTLPAHSALKGEDVSVEVTTDGGTESATVTIGNTPPHVTGGSFVDPQVRAGQAIEIVPEGEDEDGDEITGYRCVWAVNGEILPEQTTPVLPAEFFHKGDRVVVEVFASDGEAEGPPFVGKEFVIPNSPPVFVTEPPREFSASQYVYQARAEDADGDPLEYRLEITPPGMTMDAEGKITWTLDASAAGEHHIRIVATDSDGAKAVQDYTLRIAFPGG